MSMRPGRPVFQATMVPLAAVCAHGGVPQLHTLPSRVLGRYRAAPTRCGAAPVNRPMPPAPSLLGKAPRKYWSANALAFLGDAVWEASRQRGALPQHRALRLAQPSPTQPCGAAAAIHSPELFLPSQAPARLSRPGQGERTRRAAGAWARHHELPGEGEGAAHGDAQGLPAPQEVFYQELVDSAGLSEEELDVLRWGRNATGARALRPAPFPMCTAAPGSAAHQHLLRRAGVVPKRIAAGGQLKRETYRSATALECLVSRACAGARVCR